MSPAVTRNECIPVSQSLDRLRGSPELARNHPFIANIPVVLRREYREDYRLSPAYWFIDHFRMEYVSQDSVIDRD